MKLVLVSARRTSYGQVKHDNIRGAPWLDSLNTMYLIHSGSSLDSLLVISRSWKDTRCLPNLEALSGENFLEGSTRKASFQLCNGFLTAKSLTLEMILSESSNVAVEQHSAKVRYCRGFSWQRMSTQACRRHWPDGTVIVEKGRPWFGSVRPLSSSNLFADRHDRSDANITMWAHSPLDPILGPVYSAKKKPCIWLLSAVISS